jgi:1,4-alpha-glucan branching enzyme
MSRKYSGDHSRSRVTFWLPKEAAPNASSVAVAGSFSDWSVDHDPLKKFDSGDFLRELELDAGKEYDFRFIFYRALWENAGNADKYLWSD